MSMSDVAAGADPLAIPPNRIIPEGQPGSVVIEGIALDTAQETLYRVFDAATPPQLAPRSCRGVMGYIGGSRAARIWTGEEWRRFKHLRQFPIWVPSMSADRPVTAADNAAREAHRRGWLANGTRAIVCDLETQVDRQWYATWASALGGLGYHSVAYGSLSTVLGNAAQLMIVADWNNEPALQPGQAIVGDQYADDQPVPGGVVDYSVFNALLFHLGGLGPRFGS